jgi:uncharacterized protein (DUF952 family)
MTKKAMILHLISKADWDALPANEPVRVKSLESEGFIHCTKGDDLMLQVANAFYKDRPGDFIVLEIDEAKVTAEVKWEPAMPVTPPEVADEHEAPGAGEKAEGSGQRAELMLPPEVKAEYGETLASDAAPDAAPDDPRSMDTQPTEATPLFPHIYGPLNRDAIIGVRGLARAEDGTFTGYTTREPGIAGDPTNPLNLKTPSQMAQELLDATDEFSESLKRFKDSVEARMDQIDEKIKKL